MGKVKGIEISDLNHGTNINKTLNLANTQDQYVRANLGIDETQVLRRTNKIITMTRNYKSQSKVDILSRRKPITREQMLLLNVISKGETKIRHANAVSSGYDLCRHEKHCKI